MRPVGLWLVENWILKNFGGFMWDDFGGYAEHDQLWPWERDLKSGSKTASNVYGALKKLQVVHWPKSISRWFVWSKFHMHLAVLCWWGKCLCFKMWMRYNGERWSRARGIISVLISRWGYQGEWCDKVRRIDDYMQGF